MPFRRPRSIGGDYTDMITCRHVNGADTTARTVKLHVQCRSGTVPLFMIRLVRRWGHHASQAIHSVE